MKAEPCRCAVAEGGLSPRGGGCRRAGGSCWGPAPSGAAASCAGDVPPSAGGRSPVFPWRRFAGALGPRLGVGSCGRWLEGSVPGAGGAAPGLAAGHSARPGPAAPGHLPQCVLELGRVRRSAAEEGERYGGERMPGADLPGVYGPAALGEVLVLQDRDAVMCQRPLTSCQF